MKIQDKSLVINEAWCKGCNICVTFCPVNALSMTGGKAALNGKNKCILCGQCELRCPDFAIYLDTVEEEDELNA